MSFAIKRIIRDLVEINKTNHPSYSLKPIALDNLFLMHGNIRLTTGPYDGVMIHVILELDSDYPYSQPKMFIADGYPFNQNFHEHLLLTKNGLEVCNDMLANFEYYFQTTDPKSRSSWTPGLTLDGLMRTMVHFLAEPDLPKMSTPSSVSIHAMQLKILQYRCSGCRHTSSNPWPPLVDQPETPPMIDNSVRCAVSLETLDSSKAMVLGYPIAIDRSRWLVVPELISHHAYLENGEVKKTPYGVIYHRWAPVDLYTAHRERVSAIWAKIKPEFGSTTTPLERLEFYLRLIDSLELHLIVDRQPATRELLIAHWRLFQTVVMIYRSDEKLRRKIDRRLVRFLTNPNQRHRDAEPRIGQLLRLFFISGFGYTPKNQDALFFEYAVRQVRWLTGHNFTNRNVDTRVFQAFRDTVSSLKRYGFIVDYFSTVYDEKSFDEIDERFGQPTEAMVDRLKASIDRSLKTDNYLGFLKLARIDFIESKLEVYNLLNLAIFESNRQRYTSIEVGRDESEFSY